MDPRTAPVTVEVNGTAASLLVKLMKDMETADPMAVLTRALGMLDAGPGQQAPGPAAGDLRSPEPALHRSGGLAMALRIDPDHRRFRDIVRGKIKQNLSKYISQRRADRAQGQGHGVHPAAADQHAPLPLRRGKGGRRRQGPGQVGDAVGQGEPGEDGPGKAGQRPRASTPWRSSCRWTSWPRSWARSCSCRASSPRARSRSSPRRTATSASAAPVPSRCATSSAPSAQALRRQIMIGQLRPRATR